jgi:propionyl-CoA carboxylase alpha chain
MKMETGVASPMDGIVADVQVKAGQPVESDQELLQFER